MITYIYNRGEVMYTEDDEKESYEYDDNYDVNNDVQDNSEYKLVQNDDLVNYDIYQENDNNQVSERKSGGNKARIIKLIIIFVLLVILGILIYFIVTTKKLNPRIEIVNNNIVLNAGESSAISYEIVDTEERIPLTFISADESIVKVDEYGVIEGVSRGETVINIIYYIQGERIEKSVLVNVQ